MNRTRLRAAGGVALWISIFVLCIAAARLFYGAVVHLLTFARDQHADPVDAQWGASASLWAASPSRVFWGPYSVASSASRRKVYVIGG